MRVFLLQVERRIHVCRVNIKFRYYFNWTNYLYEKKLKPKNLFSFGSRYNQINAKNYYIQLKLDILFQR